MNASAGPVLWSDCRSAIDRDSEVNARIEAEVAERLGRMTAKQKIAQMIQAEISSIKPDDVADCPVGAILNGGGCSPGNNKHASVGDWLALADAFFEASTAAGGVPLIWGTDAVHGHANVFGATVFPHNIGLGAARNPQLIEAIGEATAAEIVATGIDWTFAPTLAVVRDDRWGRTYEGYSESPEIAREYAPHLVRGLQGDAARLGPGGPGKVLATAKHFIGEGGTDEGIDQGSTRCTETELRDIHGQGHMAAMAAGVQVVMASFNDWNGAKLHGHKHLLTQVLKEQMGFMGFVISDWNAFQQVREDFGAACAESVNAGIDMLMAPENWRQVHECLLSQLRQGNLEMRRVDDAVTRILRVKARMGLFAKPRPSRRPGAGNTNSLAAPRHREIARQAVRESLVLLKNEGGTLPLRPDLRVLVAGDGANNVGKQCGGWTLTWQGSFNENDDFPNADSIFRGIEACVAAGGGSVVLHEDGKFRERPDVAIVIFGEDPYAEGQGDVSHLSFSARHPEPLRILQRLASKGIPVVSVFLSGRPLWVNPELNASDAFIAAWLPGTEGKGVADVLFRDGNHGIAHDFTGRLSFSWPRDPLQAPLNQGDEDYRPLFPFGYGLSLFQPAEDFPKLSEDDPSRLLADKRVPVFDKRPVNGFELFIGDQEGWRVPVTARSASSPSGVVSVRNIDMSTQEDAREVTWHGGGAQISFHGNRPLDLTRLAGAKAQLTFEVRVDTRPESQVILRMDSAYPNWGSLDVTEILRELPQGDWQTVAIDLARFIESGTDPRCVETPFLLWTEGAMRLSVANIAIAA